jgi:hypothetical protein
MRKMNESMCKCFMKHFTSYWSNDMLIEEGIKEIYCISLVSQKGVPWSLFHIHAKSC